MAKIDIPFVGFSMDDKTLLYVLGGLALFVWLAKRDVEAKIGGALDAGKKAIETGVDVLYEKTHPKESLREKNLYWVDLWDRDFWLGTVNEQIKAAQRGEYTHRSDERH